MADIAEELLDVAKQEEIGWIKGMRGFRHVIFVHQRQGDLPACVPGLLALTINFRSNASMKKHHPN
jgi:hypothetical protein